MQLIVPNAARVDLDMRLGLLSTSSLMMRMSRTYAHTETEVRARLRALTDYWSAKHGLRIEWIGDDEVRIRGRVKGVKLDGQVTLGNGTIDAKVEAGWLAEKLGGRGYVERKLDDYLDPAHTLEELRARIPA